MTSPFLAAPPERWIASNNLAFALYDGFPLSPGHTLVIPKRLIATWFEATRAEQLAILELVDEVKAQLDAELRPDGYHIGINRWAEDSFYQHLLPLFAKAADVAILAAFSQHRGVEALEPLGGFSCAKDFEAARRSGLGRAGRGRLPGGSAWSEAPARAMDHSSHAIQVRTIVKQRAKDADPKGGVRRRRRLAGRSLVAASATRPTAAASAGPRTVALWRGKAAGHLRDKTGAGSRAEAKSAPWSAGWRLCRDRKYTSSYIDPARRLS